MKKRKKLKFIVITLTFFILIFLIISFGQKEAEENIKEKYKTETMSTYENKDYQELEKLEEQYKGYEIDSKLEIPKINLNSYVLKEFSTKSLLTSVTKYYGKEANEEGNYCIAGHNYGPDNMFQNIGKQGATAIAAPQTASLNHLIYNTLRNHLRKAAFYVLKDGLSPCKRTPFARRKVTFHKTPEQPPLYSR